MNAPIVLAQLSGSQPASNPTPRNLKMVKPQGNQAVTINLDGNTKLDFSDIASEKLTFVRVGDKLIVLFDNQSTVTIEPVFAANGETRSDVVFDLGSRVVNGTEFAELFPITTDQSVLPAAGAAAGGPTAGANFSNPNAGSLGDGNNPLALLSNEDGGGAGAGATNGAASSQPIANGAIVGNVDDEGLTDGNIGGPGDEPGAATSVTASLNIDFGIDFAGRQLAFAADQPSLTGLTTNGETISTISTTINGQPAIIGFTGTDPSVAANQVFLITLDAGPLSGEYTFTLLRPLDHPIADTEDTIVLTIGFIATDGSGDSIDATFTVRVNDDSPEIVTGQIQPGVVNEDALFLGNPGDTYSNGETPAENLTATGALGVQWGADRYDTIDSTIEGILSRQDGAIIGSTDNTQLTGRALYFTNTAVTANGAAIDAANPLTSHGQTVLFRLDESGTKLIGYVEGAIKPPSDDLPARLAEGQPERVVFTVTLSDEGSGGYRFDLFDELDHPIADAEDDLALAFNFTARDSDKDTVGAQFTVTVNDDAPLFAAVGPEAGLVNEDPLLGGNAGDTYQDGQATEKISVSGSLNILWGADNFDTFDFEGPQDRAGSGDNAQLTGRAVYFTNATVTNDIGEPQAELTSRGEIVAFRLESLGTKLVGFVAGDGDERLERIVFEITLSDDGQGSYSFVLKDVLDHPVANSEDNISLTFNITARDFDKDTASTTFSVTVNDDAPVTGAVTLGQVDEDGAPALVSGAGNRGGDGDLDAATTVSNVLNIAWGADSANSVVDGGVSTIDDVPTPVNGDRSVVFDPAIVAPKGLWSNGVQIVYTLSANGTLLTATAGEGGPTVFTVSLSDQASGSYGFTLLRNIDHTGDATGTEDDRSLTFDFVARDSDGDSRSSSFEIRINDDTAVIGKPVATTVDEDGFIPSSLVSGQGNLFGDGDDFLAPTAASGSLNISWGADNGNSRVNGGVTTGVVNGEVLPQPVEGDRSVVFDPAIVAPAGLTANGVQLVYTLSSNGTVLTATAGAEGPAVFKVTLSDVDNGSYRFELLRNLDHRVANTEDDLPLSFGFVARDSDGDATLSSFTVTVDDDTPLFLPLLPLDGAVDEDGPILAPQLGLPGSNPGPLFGSGDDLLATVVSTNSLGISWGADNGNKFVDGGVLVAPENGDRSVVFAANMLTTLAALNLTSNGTALTYELSQTGDTIFANAGSSSRPVFIISLSDQDAGYYDFALLDNLDHPAGNQENNITITFGILARDSDGDTANASFRISIDDDTPIQNNAQNASVDEEGLPGGNAGEQGVGQTSNSTSGRANADLNGASLTAGGSLGVAWGADDDKMGDIAGDAVGRKVNFVNASGSGTLLTEGAATASQLGLGTLTSDGVALKYQIVKTTIGADADWDGGYRLIAYTGADLNTGTVVFTVTLDPRAANGSYTFALLGNLDHPAPTGSALPGAENDLNLDFRFRATDSDGDVGSAETFRVTIDDDAPVIGAPEAKALTENTTSAGPAGGVETFDASTATGSLDVKWGADDANPNTGTIDRTVSFASAVANNAIVKTTANLDLTSNGATVRFVRVSATEILGVADDDNNNTVAATDRVVFRITLSDNGSGSYTFELRDNVDHVGAGQGASLALSIPFVAKDADGDTTTSVGLIPITINDDSGRPSVMSAVADQGVTEITTRDAADTFVPQTLSNVGLNIAWGADDANSGGMIDRKVAFATDLIAPSNLTSDGASVTYEFNTDRTVLTAKAGTRTVFTVTLSDADAGKYTFVLSDNIDHATGNGANVKSLTFSYVATDADGDATDPANFLVNVTDDQPIFTASNVQNGNVDDEGLSGNAGEPSSPASYIDSDLAGTQTTASGSLGVTWGSDANNSGAANRSLAFRDIVNGTNVLDGANAVVKSHGLEVKYFVADVNGVPTLIGYTGSDPSTVTNQVFKVTLDDSASNGSYNFQLLKPLDHPTANTEDDRVLNFKITATDADGDKADGAFSVTVDDDSPIINAAAVQNGFVDEERLPGGNAGGGFSDLGAPQDDGDLTATGSLGVSYGADGPADVIGSSGAITDGPVTFADQSVAANNVSITDQNGNAVSLANLTSDGQPVLFTLIDAVTLVAYTGTVPTTIDDTNVVFSAVLAGTGSGSYTFVQKNNLDHPIAGQEDDLVIRLNYTAKDFDGDKQNGSFTVTVDDDSPVVTIPSNTPPFLGVVTDETAGVQDGINEAALTTALPTALATRLTALSAGTAISLAHTAANYVTFDVGADGLKAVTLGDSSGQKLIARDSGLRTLDGTTIVLSTDTSDSNLVVGRALSNGPIVLTVYFDRSDNSIWVTQYQPISHQNGSDPNDPATILNVIFVTVTDGDNDINGAPINVTFRDDAPTVPAFSQQTGANVFVQLDDEAQTLFPGNSGGTGDVSPDAKSVTGAAGALFTPGTDGTQSVVLTQPPPVFNVIWKDSKGFAHFEAVSWTGGTNPDGSITFKAYSSHYVPGNFQNNFVDSPAAALTINKDGSYSFTLNAPVAYREGANTEENLRLVFGYRVLDRDNDAAFGTLAIDIDDDTPTAVQPFTLQFDDEAQTLFTGNPGPAITGSGDVTPDNRTLSGEAGALFSAGADGVKSIVVNDLANQSFGVIVKGTSGLANPVPETATWSLDSNYAGSGVRYVAQSASYNLVNGARIPAAELIIGVDGSYTFTLNAPVVQNSNGFAEENLELRFGYVVTDGDDDTAGGLLRVNINDDTPALPALSNDQFGQFNVGATFDDEAQAGGNVGPLGQNGLPVNGDVEPNEKTATGTLFSAGADGVRSLSVSNINDLVFSVIGTDPATGLARTELVTWRTAQSDTGTIKYIAVTAPNGSYPIGNPAAELVIGLNGSYSFKLFAPVAQSTSSLTEDNLRLNFTYALTDGDGDQTQGVLRITINDDTPTVPPPTFVQGVPQPNVTGAIDDDAQTRLSPGNILPADGIADVATVSGMLFSAGADGVQSVSIASMPPFNVLFENAQAGGLAQSVQVFWRSPTASNGEITWLATTSGPQYPANDPAAKLVIRADGTYTFTAYAPIAHPNADNSEASRFFDFSYTVTDGDGDQNSGLLRIEVGDDTLAMTGTVLTGDVYESEINNTSFFSSPVIGSDAGNTDDKNGDLANNPSNPNITNDSKFFSAQGSLQSVVAGADGIGGFTTDTDNLSNSLLSLRSGGQPLTFFSFGDRVTARDSQGSLVFEFSVFQDGSYSFEMLGRLDHYAAQVELRAPFDGFPGSGIYAPLLGANGIDAIGARFTSGQNGFGLQQAGILPDGDVILKITNTNSTPVTWTLNQRFGDGDYPDLTISGNQTLYLNIGPMQPGTQYELTGPGAFGFISVSSSGALTIVNDTTQTLDELVLDLSSFVTARDGDGDTLQLKDKLFITVKDDKPIAVTNSAGAIETGVADEDDRALPGANGSATTSVTIVKFGSDGAAATPFVLSATVDGVTGLRSNGQAVSTRLVNDVLLGYTGSPPPNFDNDQNVVFALRLWNSSNNGGYNFTLRQPLDHSAVANGVITPITLGFSAIAADRDGDTLPLSFSVQVDSAGTQSVAGTIDYTNLTSGVFVNLSETAATFEGQQVAPNTATDIFYAQKFIGIDNVTGITNATGGAGNDVLVGDAAANVLTGGAGNDTIIIAVGGGNDTVNGGNDGDRLIVNGDSNKQIVTISASDNDGDPTNGVQDPILLQIDETGDGSVDATIAVSAVEEIVLDLGGGNDEVFVNGQSFAGSSLAANTITVNEGEGDDMLDLRGLTLSNHRVVADGGTGTDTVKFNFAYPGLTNVSRMGIDGVAITFTLANGETVTHELKAYESFQFTDGTRTYAQLFNVAPDTQNASASGNEDTLIAVTLNGTDADNDLTGFVIKSLPADGTLFLNANGTGAVGINTVITGSKVYFQPAANWSGEAAFEYAARDSLGAVDATPATATVNVTAVADAPVVTLDGNTSIVAVGSEIDGGGSRFTMTFNQERIDVVRTNDGNTYELYEVSALRPGQGGASGFDYWWEVVHLESGNTYKVDQEAFRTSMNPSLVVLDDGRPMVAWTNHTRMGNNVVATVLSEPFYQIFNADPAQTSAPVPVAASGAIDLDHLSDGSLVMVWKSGLDPVMVQHFTADGVASGAAVPVPGIDTAPRIIPLDNGYALVWSSQNFDQVQRFNNDGSAAGAIQSNPHPASGDLVSQVVLADGSVAFLYKDADSVDVGIVTAGGVASQVVVVSQVQTSGETATSIVALDNGNFAVVWGAADGFDVNSFLRVFTSEGVAVSPVIELDAAQPSSIVEAIAELPNGEIAVVWQTGGALFLQRYDVDGGAVGSQLLLQPQNGPVGRLNNVLIDVVGDHFIVTWEDTPSNGWTSHTQEFALSPTVTVDEDTAIALSLSATLTDTDGSEVLGVTIAGIPAGATLTDGAGHTFTATSGNTTATVNGWTLSSLTITPPANYNGDFTLTVTATATEASNGDTESMVKTINVYVNPMNDAPVITSGVTGTEPENTAASNIVYQIAATDADAGAVLTYSLTGADANTFNLSSTGAVTFKTSPNFEAPTDADGDNRYAITVNVNDGTVTTTKDVVITVTNVNEAPVVPDFTPDVAGFAKFDGHYYQYLSATQIQQSQSASASFAVAQGAAAALKGYLANITTQAEQDFLKAQYNGTSITTTGSFSSRLAWLGGSDAEQEGVWKWVYGPEAGQTFYNHSTRTSFTPTFWNPGEPNNEGGIQDYLQILNNIDPMTGLGRFGWDDDRTTAVTPSSQGAIVERSYFTDKVTEALISTASILASVTDADGDTPTFTGLVSNTTALGGSVTIVGNNIVYNPNGAPGLAGLTGRFATLEDSFQYTVSDGHGGVTTGTVKFNVGVPQHAPEIQAPDVIAETSGSDDGRVYTGQIGVTDTDSNESFKIIGYSLQSTSDGSLPSNLFFQPVPDSGATWQGRHGTVTLNSNGSYSYKAGTQSFDFDGIAATDFEPMIVQVQDASGLISVKDVRLTFLPAAEVPVTADYTPGVEGFSYFGGATGTGHYYKYVASTGSFANSQIVALGQGGYLATITSQAEQDYLKAAYSGNSIPVEARAWLGGSDAALEGTWKWLYGPEAGRTFFVVGGPTGQNDFTAWNPLEPNNSFGGQNYLQILNKFTGSGQPGSFGWDDNGLTALNSQFNNAIVERDYFTDKGTVASISMADIILTSVTNSGTGPLTITGLVSGNTTGLTTVQTAKGGTVTIDGDNIIYDPRGASGFTNLFGFATTEDSFQYTVSNGEATATGTVRFKVGARVSAPTDLTLDAVQETSANDNGQTFTGHLRVVDADPNDSYTVLSLNGQAIGASGLTLQRNHGTITIFQDGSYSYVGGPPSNFANFNFDAIQTTVFGNGANSRPTGGNWEELQLTVIDSYGATTTQLVYLPFIAANDAPVANPDSNLVAEDGTLPAAQFSGVIYGSGGPGADIDPDNNPAGPGGLQVSGVVKGAASAVVQNQGVGMQIVGDFGTLTLFSSGAYSYVADRANALAAGQQGIDAFNYTVKDPAGAISNIATLRITVTGTNDAPVITSGDTGSEAENTAASNVVYQIIATDVDAGAAFTYSLDGADKDLFNVSSTGAVTFKTPPNFEAPADTDGDNVYNITVGVSDGIVTTTKAVTITVTNVNDAPTALIVTPQTVTENVTGATAATFTLTDPDSEASGFATYNYAITGEQASKFEVNGNTIRLIAGQSLDFEQDSSLSLTLTATNTNNGAHVIAQNFSVPVGNVNEAPALTSPASLSVAENTPATTTVYQITATDPDAGTAFTYSLSGTDAARFNINTTSGAIKFNASPDFEAPVDNGGNNVYDIIVGASDGTNTTTKAVQISVTNVVEVVNRTPDAVNDTIDFGTVTAPPSGGGWTLNNGHYYKYVYGNFSWAEANTAAIAAGGYLANITTQSENTFVRNLINASFGSFTWIGGSDAQTEGTYRFTAGPEAGQVLPYTNWGIGEPNNGLGYSGNEDYIFMFGSPGYGSAYGKWNDATGAKAADNSPGDYVGYVIEVGGIPPANEDDIKTFSTSLVLANDTDPDGNPLTVTSVSGAGFSLSGTTITFNPSAVFALNPMNTSMAAEVYFDYTISDGQGGTDTATGSFLVYGLNDLPAGTNATLTINEDVPRSFAYADFGFNDVDLGDTMLAVRIDTLPGAGTLRLSGNAVTAGQIILAANLGNLVYTPAANASGSNYASFTFSVQDQSSAFDAAPNTITINVNAVDDPSVIGGVITRNLTETNAVQSTSGQLTISDVDSAAPAFLARSNVNGSNGYGKFTIDTAGAWTYTMNTAHDEFVANTTYTDTLTVMATDGTTQVLTVNIAGTNDAAVVTNAATAASGSVTEATSAAAGSPTAGGNLNSTDVDGTADAWQAVSTSTATASGYGTYTVSAGGIWGYSLNNANTTVNNLNNGQTLTDTFTVRTADGTSQQVSVTINGATDPVQPPPTATSATVYNYGQGTNSTAQNAYDITGLNYVLSTDPDIAKASVRPSITIAAQATSGQTDFYYLFISQNNTRVIFDIDYGMPSVDTWLQIYNSSNPLILGPVLHQRNDFNATNPSNTDPGSSSGWDAYLDVTLNLGIYYIQVGRSNAAGSQFLNFNNSATYEMHVSFVPVNDPIILDLGAPGIALSTAANGVAFDMDADGVKENLAWTQNHDGILVADLDHSGKIENGREVFSPFFNGGTFKDALEALAVLDSNHDGRIDAADADFAKLSVWQDTNRDGITDAGELKSLTEHGITAIPLDASAVSGDNNGSAVLAEGTFERADGSTGSFIEVEFAEHIADPVARTTDGNDVISGGAANDTLAGGKGNDELRGNGGADRFVFAEQGAGNLDRILDYNGAEGDVIDISALLKGTPASAANIDSYVHLDRLGGDVTVQVDVSGSGQFGGGANDVATLHGAGASNADIVRIAFQNVEHQMQLPA